MCLNKINQSFIRGWNGGAFCIKSYDRKNSRVINEIKCHCDHGLVSSCICEHPVDPDVVLETCWECGKIRSYNMNTGKSADIYTESAVTAICTGPAGSILGVGEQGRITKFRLKNNCEELELVHSVETNIRAARYMCYVEQRNTLFLSTIRQICAVAVRDGSIIWKFNHHDIDPSGLCHEEGRICVANDRGGVVTFDSRNGKLLQQLIQDVVCCRDVFWTSAQPQLTVLHSKGLERIVSTFYVGET